MRTVMQTAQERPRRENASVWFWLLGMSTLGCTLPVLASDAGPRALSVSLDLESLANLAVRLGSCLSSAATLSVWLGLIALTSLPGFFFHSPHLQRLYALGGATAVVLLGLLGWAVLTSAG